MKNKILFLLFADRTSEQQQQQQQQRSVLHNKTGERYYIDVNGKHEESSLSFINEAPSTTYGGVEV
jgi:hypothetical protein